MLTLAEIPPVQFSVFDPQEQLRRYKSKSGWESIKAVVIPGMRRSIQRYRFRDRTPTTICGIAYGTMASFWLGAPFPLSNARVRQLTQAAFGSDPGEEGAFQATQRLMRFGYLEKLPRTENIPGKAIMPNFWRWKLGEW
jgi:hypothetical protein